MTLAVVTLLQLRSMEVKLEHPSNILDILVTFDVLRLLKPVKEVRLDMPQNHP